KTAIDETNRRREIQIAYNKKHGITPTTIKKPIRDIISISSTEVRDEMKDAKDAESMSREQIEKEVVKLEKKMKKAAAELAFEEAVVLRDRIIELKKALLDL
ncbi:MAG: UvrB/UvrC motif-containing protein, partial [Lachnospiraceae bacterium]|nr:UvrB/UvrC motif-containing protein [Lachnospiraceae bacterium]